MRQLINISDMFHDDTLQCKTFILCSQEETYYVEIDHPIVQKVLSQVETAIKNGKSYLNVRQQGLVYNGRYWDDSILEISWD